MRLQCVCAVACLLLAVVCLPFSVYNVETIVSDLGDGAPGAGGAYLRFGAAFNALIAAKLPEIEEQIKTMALPDIAQHVSTPIGHIDLTLSEIRLNGFKMTSIASSSSATGPVFQVSGVAANMALNWRWKKSHNIKASDHGTATASFAGGAISFTVGMSVSAGDLVLKASAVSVSLGNFNLNLKSKYSWLYDIVKSSISSSAKSSAVASIQAAITKAVSDESALIAKTWPLSKTVFPWGMNVTINTAFSLVSSDASTVFLEVNALTIPDDVLRTACHYAPKAIASTSATEKLLSLVVDESAVKCMSWSLFVDDLFKTVVTDVPNLPLNTSDWEDIIPGLAEKFPNRQMEIHVAASSEPGFSFKPDTTVGVEIPTYLQFFVQIESSIAHAFTLESTFTFDVAIAVAGESETASVKVTGHMGDVDFTAEVASSDVGEIDVAPLKDLFSFLSAGAQGYVNNILEAGVEAELPAVGSLQPINLSVTSGTGFFEFAGDAKFA